MGTRIIFSCERNYVMLVLLVKRSGLYSFAKYDLHFTVAVQTILRIMYGDSSDMRTVYGTQEL